MGNRERDRLRTAEGIMNRRLFLTAATAASFTAGSVSAELSSVVAADPAMAFMNHWNALEKQANALEWDVFEAFYRTNVFPIEKAAKDGDVPIAESAEGAAAMLRKALSWDDMEEMDAHLVRSALAYLERTGR